MKSLDFNSWKLYDLSIFLIFNSILMWRLGPDSAFKNYMVNLNDLQTCQEHKRYYNCSKNSQQFLNASTRDLVAYRKIKRDS